MNHETLRQRVKTAENAEPPEAVAESAKDAEIAALRKQVRELEMERDYRSPVAFEQRSSTLATAA